MNSMSMQEQPGNFADAEAPDLDPDDQQPPKETPQKPVSAKTPRGRPPGTRKPVAAAPTPLPQVSVPDAAPTDEERLSQVSAAHPPTNETSTPGGRNVCILLPQYKQTNPLTLTSVLGLRDAAKNSAVVHYGDAFIVHTRNRLAHTFMTQTKAEWALFLDDDMVFPFGNAEWFNSVTGFGLPAQLAGLHTIDRLLSANKTLVGGLYFGRHAGPARRAMFAEGGVNGPFSGSGFAGLPANKVVPTRWVGTGCLLAHRSVFLAIQQRYPHLAPPTPGEPWQYFSAASDSLIEAAQQYIAGTGSKEALATALRTSQNRSLGMGEDVLFCERARVAGHQPHVDLGLLCGHLGNIVFGVPR